MQRLLNILEYFDMSVLRLHPQEQLFWCYGVCSFVGFADKSHKYFHPLHIWLYKSLEIVHSLFNDVNRRMLSMKRFFTFITFLFMMYGLTACQTTGGSAGGC